MQTIKRIAAVACCMVFLAACNQHTTGQQFSVTSVGGVRVGMSKEAVQQVLGEPTQQTITAKDRELWRYTHSITDSSDASAKAAGSLAATTAVGVAGAFVPFGGLLMIPVSVGSATTPVSVISNHNTVEIEFVKGKVAFCKLQISNMITTAVPGTIVGGGSSDVKQQTREVPCEQAGTAAPLTQATR